MIMADVIFVVTTLEFSFTEVRSSHLFTGDGCLDRDEERCAAYRNDRF